MILPTTGNTNLDALADAIADRIIARVQAALAAAGAADQSSSKPGGMLSVDQAWQLIGGKKVITRQALYLAVQRGDFPSVRWGKRILIPRHAFQQFIDGQPKAMAQ